MKKLVLFGNAELAELTHYYFSKDSDYKVVAFSVDGEYIKESHLKQLPVIPFDNILATHSPEDHHMFVALGYKNMNELRKITLEEGTI